MFTSLPRLSKESKEKLFVNNFFPLLALLNKSTYSVSFPYD